MRSGFKPLLGAVCALHLSGCIGWQSALSPHGAQSGSLLRLIWLFVIVCAVVWILVIVVLAGALFRRRPIGNEPPLLEPSRESRLNGIIAAATVMTVLVIGTLTLVSFVATRGLDSADENVLTLRMRGFQWWWEITYLDASRPDRIFLSPNEIHVPVGRPVRVRLSADDVIHSFWVPSLAGKKDLIPGRDNAITFTATRPGVYRGQCAEFCGLQHAHMAFLVIAETPQSFEAWRRSQIAEAASPSNDEEKRGQSVFTVKACAACHTVRGTSASGSLGPDLTHVASRRYIASGLLETTRGSLAAWIADPQTLKPGSNMPSVPLSSDELRDVSAYMASLK